MTGASARGSRRWLVIGAAAAAVITAGAAVVLTSNAEPAGAPSATGVARTEVLASGGPVDVGQPGPEVAVAALRGQDVELPAGRPTVVFFFAAWCGTCIPEAQALDELQDDLGDEVVILAIDADPGDTPEAIEEFMAAAGDPDYSVAQDVDGALTQAFNITALDATVVMDASGTVVFRDSVPTTIDELRDALRRAGI